jgi:hypothetical protein
MRRGDDWMKVLDYEIKDTGFVKPQIDCRTCR